ncbi:unnamed protein product [Lupinus luteus]|uniref:Retrotransposon gag domain-containing protein n=1 Tax=Lupinus luteus TaxID=3873 RepID=A0AAV1XEC1_LUPLU
MTTPGEDWEQEREEMRARLEFAEALTKKHEEQIATLVTKLGHRGEAESPNRGGGFTASSVRGGAEVHRRDKWRKSEIPIFSGEDAFGWTRRLERYFQPSMIQNPFEQLLSLKQTGSVEEFVEEFEKYVGALRSIDQEFARGIFLNGLKEELRAEVKLYELHSLADIIQKVLLIEQKNVVLSKKRGDMGEI